MRLRRDLGIAGTLSCDGLAKRGTQNLLGNGARNGAGSFLVTSGPWGRPEISDAAPESCLRAAAGTQPGARPQTARALPTRRNDLPSAPRGSN